MTKLQEKVLKRLALATYLPYLELPSGSTSVDDRVSVWPMDNMYVVEVTGIVVGHVPRDWLNVEWKRRYLEIKEELIDSL